MNNERNELIALIDQSRSKSDKNTKIMHLRNSYNPSPVSLDLLISEKSENSR